MACIEGFYIYNAKGDPIIHRVYRGDVSLRVVSDVFRTRVLHSQAQAAQSAPVCQAAGITLAHVVSRDIFLLAVLKDNANVMLVMKWLHSMLNVFTQYFGVVKAASIHDNFTLIYELLDECCDFGIPQLTEPSILKEYIFLKGTVKAEKKKEKKRAAASNVTLQVTGAVAHRNPGAKYKKNEVFLDIVETTHVLLATDGTVLRSEVSGCLMMKAFLSGLPTCSLALNTRGEDCTFNSVVDQREWDASQSISFVPPDNGNKSEFEVMRYRIGDQVKPPFRVTANVSETGRTRAAIDVNVRSLFERSVTANSVVLCVPVPAQTAKVSLSKSKGDAKYDGSAGVIRWTISKFRGQKEHKLSVDVVLVSTTREKKPWTRPPITMQFNVPMFSASPLKVLYLRIQERNNYSVEKWVRKVCKAGNYHCRMK